MLVSKFNLKITEEEEEEQDIQIVEEVVPEEQPEPRMLEKPEVRVGLSWLGKTADGEGYTYLQACLRGMKLTDISVLKAYKHLQFVDVSENYLTIEALDLVTKLPFLSLIHADLNQLRSAALSQAKYLQVIILNNNKIPTVSDVYQPELTTLEVGFNAITEIHFDDKMPTMRVLDFRNNLIKDISNIDNFPNLDSLYLAFNKLTTLVGVEKLVNLRILHVRGNPIRFLNGFTEDLKKLKYVNLRSCKVATLRQIKKLRVLPAIDELILKGNPYMGGDEAADQAAEEEDPEIRVEVLATIPRLTRLNKTKYTPEEKKEAKDLMLQWLEEGEKEEDEEVLEEHPEGEEQGNVQEEGP